VTKISTFKKLVKSDLSALEWLGNEEDLILILE